MGQDSHTTLIMHPVEGVLRRGSCHKVGYTNSKDMGFFCLSIKFQFEPGDNTKSLVGKRQAVIDEALHLVSIEILRMFCDCHEIISSVSEDLLTFGKAQGAVRGVCGMNVKHTHLLRTFQTIPAAFSRIEVAFYWH